MTRRIRYTHRMGPTLLRRISRHLRSSGGGDRNSHGVNSRHLLADRAELALDLIKGNDAET